MKLLSKTDAGNSLKKENEQLIESNIRLRKFWNEITQKLNDVRDNYEPEKMAKLKEFEQFCKDLLIKKEKLLQEYSALETEIQKKKDIYYGMIEKQDLLDEKIYQVAEAIKKLELREKFVMDLESKWREKNVETD